MSFELKWNGREWSSVHHSVGLTGGWDGMGWHGTAASQLALGCGGMCRTLRASQAQEWYFKMRLKMYNRQKPDVGNWYL